MLNELPRFLRKKHLILAGLWVSKTEPDMAVFLDPLVTQANKLSSEGFDRALNGIKINSKLFPLACCVDSPCRCAMLNMKKFNCQNGCTYSNHPTVTINKVCKYPIMSEVPI